METLSVVVLVVSNLFITQGIRTVICLVCLSMMALTPFYGYSQTSSVKEVRVWGRDFVNPQTLDFIQLALDKAKPRFGAYQLVSVTVPSREKAIESVSFGGKLDLVALALNPEREKTLLPIYVPMERGLLGFRMCAILPRNQSMFEELHTAEDFKANGVQIGVADNWIDKDILTYNQFSVYTAENYNALVNRLKSEDFICFSRSMKEITMDLSQLDGVVGEQSLGFVYQLAKILYVNPANQELYNALSYGLDVAVKDGSYYDLFEKTYQNVLSDYNFYYRKLFFLRNPNITEKGAEAINRYGIASFSNKYEKP